MDKDKFNDKNPIQALFKRIKRDNSLSTSQISLVMAIYYYSDDTDEVKSFTASRRKLMGFSKIRSISTYHACIHALIKGRYIEYFPSYHPLLGSTFRFLI